MIVSQSCQRHLALEMVHIYLDRTSTSSSSVSVLNSYAATLVPYLGWIDPDKQYNEWTWY